MSFAGDRDPAIMRHLAIARDKGIVLIAAVGNDGQRSPARFPAADPIVIAVTATDENDRLFNAANGWPATLQSPLPAWSILLPAPKGQLAFRTGTSYAAPWSVALSLCCCSAIPASIRMLCAPRWSRPPGTWALQAAIRSSGRGWSMPMRHFCRSRR